MSHPGQSDCHIEFVPKPRPGRTKYWCFAHEASATARYGSRMDRCEGAYRTIPTTNRLFLNPHDFPGGVALWGAVEPVINTTGRAAERGIHVHARCVKSGRKEIDRTFDAVEINVRRDLIEDKAPVIITSDTAVAYYISRFLGHEASSLFCPHCSTPHLDSDWFAVKPHKTHLCHGCNKLFRLADRTVSNPLESAQLSIARGRQKLPQRAKECLVLKSKDFPGGFQIWASNPAILWTSLKREEAGIHVHAWAGQGRPDPDGTFDAVMIDGHLLNEEHLRTYMAQNSLYYLRGKVKSVVCRSCGHPHFDKGPAAFRPSLKKQCVQCGEDVSVDGKRMLFVSNPFVDVVSDLQNGKI